MAFPVVEATATSNGKSTSLSVTLPASIASGDLLVLFMAGRDNVGTGGIGFPAGWTELHDDLDTGDSRTAVAYRIADGTEGASITVTMSSARDLVSLVYRISGTSGNAPEMGTATGDSNSPNPPSLTPSWGSKDTLWLVYGSGDNGKVYTAAPTSYTDLIAQDRGQAASGSARRENATATEDPGTFTMESAEAWQTVTLAVEPAGGGTDTPVNMDAGSYSQTGQTATVTLNTVVDPTVGSYSFSGLDNTVIVSTPINMDAGSFAFSGLDSVVSQALTVNMDAGSFVLIGLSVVVSKDTAVSADVGNYAFAGEDSSVLLSVSPGAGGYTLTGYDATVSTVGVTPIIMDAGSYVVSGLSATITTSIVYDMDTGSFLLSGHDLTVSTGLDITMDTGSFALTGHASALSINRAIVTDVGSYVFAGYVATIVAEGQSSARVVDAFNPEDNTVTLSQANSVSVGGNNSVTVNTKNNG